MTKQQTAFNGFWRFGLGGVIILMESIKLDMDTGNKWINGAMFVFGIIIFYIGCNDLSSLWGEDE